MEYFINYIGSLNLTPLTAAILGTLIGSLGITAGVKFGMPIAKAILDRLGCDSKHAVLILGIVCFFIICWIVCMGISVILFYQ